MGLKRFIKKEELTFLACYIDFNIESGMIRAYSNLIPNGFFERVLSRLLSKQATHGETPSIKSVRGGGITTFNGNKIGVLQQYLRVSFFIKSAAAGDNLYQLGAFVQALSYAGMTQLYLQRGRDLN